MSFKSSMRKISSHLNTKWCRGHDDNLLYLIKNLIKLHGSTNVFNIVQPLQITSRNVRFLVFKSCGDNKAIPFKNIRANIHSTIFYINPCYDCLKPEVNTNLSIVLRSLKKETLKIWYFTAVYEWYS